MQKIALLLCALFITTSAYASSSDFTGNVNLFGGIKSINDDTWEANNIDSQLEFGILFNIKQESWPISITADFLRSSETNEDSLKGTTTEFDLGITKHWEENSFTPYVGGGIAIINAEISLNAYNADETEVGVWGKAGIFTTLDDGTNIGIEARYSHAETDFNGADVQIGGLHTGIFVGYHF